MSTATAVSGAFPDRFLSCKNLLDGWARTVDLDLWGGGEDTLCAAVVVKGVHNPNVSLLTRGTAGRITFGGCILCFTRWEHSWPDVAQPITSLVRKQTRPLPARFKKRKDNSTASHERAPKRRVCRGETLWSDRAREACARTAQHGCPTLHLPTTAYRHRASPLWIGCPPGVSQTMRMERGWRGVDRRKPLRVDKDVCFGDTLFTAAIGVYAASPRQTFRRHCCCSRHGLPTYHGKHRALQKSNRLLRERHRHL